MLYNNETLKSYCHENNIELFWTNQEKNNVLEKQLYAINLGYKYEIWVFDKNGNKLQVL
jgi:hypothetical protein